MMAASANERRTLDLRGGGGGISTALPELIDKAKARELAGDQFDEAAFDGAARDGMPPPTRARAKQVL